MTGTVSEVGSTLNPERWHATRAFPYFQWRNFNADTRCRDANAGDFTLCTKTGDLLRPDWQFVCRLLRINEVYWNIGFWMEKDTRNANVFASPTNLCASLDSRNFTMATSEKSQILGSKKEHGLSSVIILFISQFILCLPRQ